MANVATILGNGVIDRIARELVRVEHFSSGSVISTPVLYPSGASVVVQIREVGPRFFVSDMGMGHQEAELMGATATYKKEAKAVAIMAGVRFDDHAFFEVDVSREMLAGAIAVIANCSSEATILTAYRLSERKEEDAADRLYDRLAHVFSPRRVARDAEIRGASATAWRITALVSDGARPTAFEPVTKHHASVYATATKFHDLARLEVPPKRVAVVKSKSALETSLGILSQAGHVIEFQASDATYSQLADAA